ncbi:roadblock/LC7 domain-containing protein [Kitasatospora sp. NPDC059571]|uniref:roadblock/LC7 domain-containing protein n=1 Tax=Kitasatospora sp. NPDC059571 TaxID=3346871 RepID=UPI0036BAA3A4
MNRAHWTESAAGRLLDELIAVAGTREVLLLSHDGSLRAHPRSIDRHTALEQASRFAAVQSASRNAAELCGPGSTPWQQSLIEFAGGFVFLLALDETSYLAVSASALADVAVIAFRMHLLVDKLVGETTASAHPDI